MPHHSGNWPSEQPVVILIFSIYSHDFSEIGSPRKVTPLVGIATASKAPPSLGGTPLCPKRACESTRPCRVLVRASKAFLITGTLRKRASTWRFSKTHTLTVTCPLQTSPRPERELGRLDATEGGHFYATSEEAQGGRDHPEAPSS